MYKILLNKVSGSSCLCISECATVSRLFIFEQFALNAVSNEVAPTLIIMYTNWSVQINFCVCMCQAFCLLLSLVCPVGCSGRKEVVVIKFCGINHFAKSKELCYKAILETVVIL